MVYITLAIAKELFRRSAQWAKRYQSDQNKFAIELMMRLMVSVITVLLTLIPDTIFMYLVNFLNVSVHFILKTVNLRPILYEKLWMKVYLNNEKTHVGCWALHDILWGLKYHSDTLYSPGSYMCIAYKWRDHILSNTKL